MLDMTHKRWYLKKNVLPLTNIRDMYILYVPVNVAWIVKLSLFALFFLSILARSLSNKA